MAISITASSSPYSVGNVRYQMCDFSAASGDTGTTLTIPSIASVKHVLIGSKAVLLTAAPTFSGNVVTLAFTVPASHTAAKVTQGLTLTSVASTQGANLITIAFTPGATAGAEVVTVTGNAISVQVETGVSTVTQVRTAMQLVAACTALVTTTGTDTATVATASALPLLGGVTGGAKGTLLAMGT